MSPVTLACAVPIVTNKHALERLSKRDFAFVVGKSEKGTMVDVDW